MAPQLTQDVCAPAARQASPSPYRHFVIAAILYLLILQCVALLPSIPGSLAGNADFRNLYTAGYMVRSGARHRLYDYQLQGRLQGMLTSRPGLLPYVYPACTALLFAPLSLLGYRAAYGVFFAANLLLLWLSARLMRDNLPHLAALWPPLPVALFFCFLPATVALMHGQTSILLLALYCAAFASLRKERPLLAGILVGLAVLKIQFALPVALLFFLWRRWRFVAGFLAGTAAALVVSLGVTGYAVFVQYWRSLLLTAADVPGRIKPLHMPPAMMANLHGFAQLLLGGAPWVARLAVAASLLLLLWIARRPASLPIAIAGALLISPYMGVHDLTLLLLPLVLALDHAAAHPRERRARATAAVSLFLLFPPVYLLLLKWHLIAVLAMAVLALTLCLANLNLTRPASGPQSAASQ
jgi:Glycosyltransferase family 87